MTTNHYKKHLRLEIPYEFLDRIDFLTAKAKNLIHCAVSLDLTPPLTRRPHEQNEL